METRDWLAQHPHPAQTMASPAKNRLSSWELPYRHPSDNLPNSFKGSTLCCQRPRLTGEQDPSTPRPMRSSEDTTRTGARETDGEPRGKEAAGRTQRRVEKGDKGEQSPPEQTVKNHSFFEYLSNPCFRKEEAVVQLVTALMTAVWPLRMRAKDTGQTTAMKYMQNV